MKVTQMPPVHSANLVANSGNTAYEVDVIRYWYVAHINGLVQERHNSIANTLELRLSCTDPSIYFYVFYEMLSVFVLWYRGIFWFNPNMQSLTLGLTLTLPSPDAGRITYHSILVTNASLLLCEKPSAVFLVIY